MTDLRTLTDHQLKERMRETDDRAKALTGHEKLTRSQQAELQEINIEFDHLEIESRSRKLNALNEGLRTGELTTQPGSIGDDHKPFGRSERGDAAKVIEAAFRSGALPDYAAERATGLVESGGKVERDQASRWITTTGDPAYMRAFAKLCADPERGHLLWTPQEHEAYQRVAAFDAEYRSMSLTDSAGGYMVPFQLDPSIILTNAGSINPIRQVARTVQTTTDAWSGVTSAGVTAEWLAEGDEAAEAEATLAQPTIPVHKGSAYLEYSYEVGMDAIRFVEEMQKLLTDGYDQLQATAFVTGSGTGQPTGIMTALDGTASEVSPTAAETFAAGDVYKVLEAVPPRFRANATWQANLAVLNTLDQFETTGGARKFPEVENGTLLRRAIYENSHMDGVFSAAATADNFLLICGDWSNYVIVDRIGTTVDLIPHVIGANRRPVGKRGLHLWGRVGADSVNDNAFRVLNIATTA